MKFQIDRRPGTLAARPVRTLVTCVDNLLEFKITTGVTVLTLYYYYYYYFFIFFFIIVIITIISIGRTSL